MAAALTAGCSTFSDSDAVARVETVELSSDDLDALLDEQDVPADQRNDLDIARAAISGWIESTAVDEGLFSADLLEEIPEDELIALYRQGLEASGVTCARLLIAPSLDAADDAADRLRSGDGFDAVFEDLNIDPDLAAVEGEVGCFDLNRVVTPGSEPTNEIQALLSVNASNPIVTSMSSSAEGDPVGLLFAYTPPEDLSDEDRVPVLDLIRQHGGVGLVLDDIDVHVDSRYGTFDRDSGSVVPLG